MESDIFRAGVAPGGPTSHDEIKMLVLHILSRIGKPMRFSQLHEALEEKDLVNYFELVRVVDGLIKTGHIVAEEGEAGERYSITEIGLQAAEAFETTLPLAVREKAVEAADKLLRRQKREAEVSVQIRSEGGGYRVELAIPEGEGSLVSFSLFAPTWEESERIRRRFLNDPMFIYKGVVALLTGDNQVLGKIFPQQERLF